MIDFKMFFSKFFLGWAIFVSLLSISLQDSAPIIEIANGKIKGEDKESRDERDFYAYRGIPYAKAKRFETPQKPDNWTDTLDAEEYGKKCIHYSTYEKKVVGSEDCLSINVFTPKIGEGLSKKLLPVMAFTSGSFMEGTTELGGHYFMDEDVVLVTFNSRLNVFGYLSTGDETIPGNFGMKDQVMALQWIQENIRKFAGDSNRVTIFGSGDGASSVHLLMLSPMGKGKFKKAITQSGSALKLSTIQRRPKEAAQRLAQLLDCEKILNSTENSTKTSDCSWNNSTLILECLKLVDAKKLAEVQKEGFGPLRDPLAFFGPVVEFSAKDSQDIGFLTEHPFAIISTGRQQRVPWMTGINVQEGLISTGVILNDKSFVDKIDSHWSQLSARLLSYDWTRTDITNQIRRFYLSESNYEFVETVVQEPLISDQASLPISSVPNSTVYPNLNTIAVTTSLPTLPTQHEEVEELNSINFEEQFKSFTDLFTDRFYASPMYTSVHMQSKHSPVYVYYNAYEGQFSLLDVYAGQTKEPAPTRKKVSNWFKKNILGRKVQTPKHMGVCNGDELPLLFKYPDLKIKDKDKDYQMSKDLVKLWVQFAYDESKMVFHNSTWLPVNSGNGRFRVLKMGNTQEDSGFAETSEKFISRMKFWSNLKYLAPFDQ